MKTSSSQENASKEERKCFPFFGTFKESIDLLENPGDRLMMYEAICTYGLTHEKVELKGVAKAMWPLVEPLIESGWKKYVGGQKGAEHGVKGGNPNFKKGQSNPYYQQDNPSDNPSDNGSDNGSESVEDNPLDNPLDNPSTTPAITQNKRKSKNKKELSLGDSSLHSESLSTDAVDPHITGGENGGSDDETLKPSMKFPKQEPAIDYVKLADYWNAKMQGKQIPSIQSVTKKRKAAISARMSEYGKEAIMKVIDKAAASAFLNGSNNRAWVADFDWIMRPNNFPKVLEGNYDAKKPASGTSEDRTKRANDAAAIIARLAHQEQYDKRRGCEVTAVTSSDYEGDF